MKALSLRQPFANMVATGEKTIETRTWSTKYRGRVAICSAKSRKGYNDLPPEPPYGAIVAVATIVDCKPMQYEDELDAQCTVYPEAWSWFLEDIVRVKPVPVKGALSLFEIDLAEEDLEPYE